MCFVSKLRSFFVIFLLIYFARPLWRQYFIRVSNCHGSSMVTGLFPSSVFGVLVVCLASWDEWILKVKGSSQCQRSKSGCRPSTRLWSRVLSVLSGLCGCRSIKERLCQLFWWFFQSVPNTKCYRLKAWMYWCALNSTFKDRAPPKTISPHFRAGQL